MESRFDRDCNLWGGRVDRRVSYKPYDKDAIRRSEEPRKSFTLATDRLEVDLRLKPEQAGKIEPILRQVNTEFSNLLSLDLREREGILSRGQDRMNPILEPDQRARLQEIIEEEKRRVRLWFGAGESQR
jgi:hypothetical protein